MHSEPFAVSSLFHISVGDSDLGSFTGCDGLGCVLDSEEHTEGGLNDHVWHLPTRMRYTNVVLTRPLTRQTTLVWLWMRQQIRQPLGLPGQIVALGPDRRPLIRWVLANVLPVRWSGPSFDADQSQPARETLEITHDGFVEVTL
ncbi:phage tail protein [Embleya hyalina]|uniref:Phage tail protein n=1 Tax=Embleya hyalina TaxID=516124 RepID=A0A401Z4K5_9ACTN|nr:phage tail protein [Embleya hyalina]GCE01792.1 phage tail protein [Embleya hyalina]